MLAVLAEVVHETADLAAAVRAEEPRPVAAKTPTLPRMSRSSFASRLTVAYTSRYASPVRIATARVTQSPVVPRKPAALRPPSA